MKISNTTEYILMIICVLVSAWILWSFKLYLTSLFMMVIFGIYCFAKKQAKKWHDTSLWLSDVTLIFLFTSPILAYIFISLTDYFVRIYPGFITIQGSKGDWIGFLGSIFGGSMTMLAVLFTFSYEKQVKQRELEMQYRPIVDINVKCEENTAIASIIPTFKKQLIAVEISNISTNHIMKLKVDSVRIIWLSDKSDDEPKDKLYEFSPVGGEKSIDLGIIAANKSNLFYPDIFDNLDSVSEILKNDNFSINVHISVSYFDIFENGPYMQESIHRLIPFGEKINTSNQECGKVYNYVSQLLSSRFSK